ITPLFGCHNGHAPDPRVIGFLEGKIVPGATGRPPLEVLGANQDADIAEALDERTGLTVQGSQICLGQLAAQPYRDNAVLQPDDYSAHGDSVPDHTRRLPRAARTDPTRSDYGRCRFQTPDRRKPASAIAQLTLCFRAENQRFEAGM